MKRNDHFTTCYFSTLFSLFFIRYLRSFFSTFISFVLLWLTFLFSPTNITSLFCLCQCMLHIVKSPDWHTYHYTHIIPLRSDIVVSFLLLVFWFYRLFHWRCRWPYPISCNPILTIFDSKHTTGVLHGSSVSLLFHLLSHPTQLSFVFLRFPLKLSRSWTQKWAAGHHGMFAI